MCSNGFLSKTLVMNHDTGHHYISLLIVFILHYTHAGYRPGNFELPSRNSDVMDIVKGRLIFKAATYQSPPDLPDLPSMKTSAPSLASFPDSEPLRGGALVGTLSLAIICVTTATVLLLLILLLFRPAFVVISSRVKRGWSNTTLGQTSYGPPGTNKKNKRANRRGIQR